MHTSEMISLVSSTGIFENGDIKCWSRYDGEDTVTTCVLEETWCATKTRWTFVHTFYFAEHNSSERWALHIAINGKEVYENSGRTMIEVIGKAASFLAHGYTAPGE